MADRDNKPDSPQMKDQRSQKTHTNQVQAKWVRNQHVIEHQIKIRQSGKLKMTNRRTYMKPRTEQKYAWEQFLT